MGRPINHRFFGDNNIFASGLDLGGEGIASITLTGTNNSTSYTAGATQVSIAAPAVAGGRTATAALVVGPVGALTSGTTFTTVTGTKVAGNVTALVVPVKSTSGTGTGATFAITTTGGAGSYTSPTITVVTGGTGYATTNTVTIDGALLGGATTTNDLTFTLATFVAAAGTITSITITDAGAGYDAVPTVTLSTGSPGTLTTLAVLTAGAAARDNAILCSSYIPASTSAGFISGSSGAGLRAKSDIVRQVGARSYVVQNSDGIGRCTIKGSLVNGVFTGAAASAAGEMHIIANDSTGTGTYYVTKLTSRKAYLTQATGSGHEFASGSVVQWTLGSAVLNTSVSITNA
jgi:hypothetical protein